MPEILDEPYSADPHELQYMDWFIPDSPNGQAIFFIHGGGWSGGSRKQWQAVARHFTDQGYCCASTSYRLVPHGRFEDQMTDVRLAMATFRSRADEYGFSVDRVAAVGSSAGGHLVAMLATTADDDDLGVGPELSNRYTRPNAAICYCPVTTMCDRGAVERYYSETVVTFLGGTPDEAPEQYERSSPLTQITGDEPPFLFIHGDQDDTVSLRHASEMHRMLLEQDVPSQLLVLAGVGHGFGYGVGSDAQKTSIDHVGRWLKTIKW